MDRPLGDDDARPVWELTPEEEARADRLYWEREYAGDDE